MKNQILKQNVYDFIEERLEESYSKLAKKESFKTIEQNYNDKFQEIESKLLKKEKLLEEYKANEYDLYDMQLQQAYKTGFKDSLQLIMKEV